MRHCNAPSFYFDCSQRNGMVAPPRQQSQLQECFCHHKLAANAAKIATLPHLMSEIADRDRGHGLERCVKGGLCDPTGHGAIVSPRLRECNFQSTLDILSWIALDCLSLNSDRDGRGHVVKLRGILP